jgi:hypothetical protein
MEKIFEKVLHFSSKGLHLKKTSITYKVKLTAPEPSLVGHVFNHQENAPPSRTISFFYPFFLVLIIACFPCTLSQAGLVWRTGGEGWKLRGTMLQPRAIIKTSCDPL